MKRNLHLISCFILMGMAITFTGCRTSQGDGSDVTQRQPPDFLPFQGTPLRLPLRNRHLEGFERLGSLQVTSESGEAFLIKNTEQAIWGAAAAELRYISDRRRGHSVVLRSDPAWRMLSLFDTISIWIRDPGEGAVSATHHIVLHLQDSSGQPHEVSFPYMPSDEWQLLHTRLSTSIPLPVTIDRLEWKLPNGRISPRRILLEGLSFYQEVLSRIPSRVSYVRPFGYAPAFAPVRKNSVTLNFPTTPFAFSPKSKETRYQSILRNLDEEEGYLFTSRSSSGSITYKIRPMTGGPRIELQDEKGKWNVIWTGPRVESLGESPTLRFARVNDNELSLQYTDGVRFLIQMKARTLILNVESMREDLVGLDLGLLNGDQQVHVPFLRTGIGESVPVQFLKSSTTPLFICAFPDWWFSMASEYQSGEKPQEVGRMSYTPRWRGSRNLFRERIYFTASSSLEEVLPTISTPKAMYMEDSITDYWPRPERIPHAMFRLKPTEQMWSDQFLARNPDGEWRSYPDQDGVVLKTALAEDVVIPRLLRHQTSDSESLIYLPETTAYGPWTFTDYDNRVIGAGTYAQTYAEMGALLQQAEAEWGKPLYGVGGAELLWAGFVSRFVPEFPSRSVWEEPWIPHLSWNSIAPTTKILGMGEFSSFRDSDESPKEGSGWLDRSIATQVVYGAVGRLPPLSSVSQQNRLHARKLMDAFQEAFYHQRAERIAYWDGEDFVSLSSAFQKGIESRNQMYIRLTDQSELWVNGSDEDFWERRVGDTLWNLPPFGLLFRGPNHMIVHLPESEKTARRTGIKTPTSTWVFSLDQKFTYGGVRVQGSLHIQEEQKGEWRMDLTNWQGEARFDPETFSFDQVRSIKAIDVEGKVVSGLRFLREDQDWVLTSERNLKTVWISENLTGIERNLSP